MWKDGIRLWTFDGEKNDSGIIQRVELQEKRCSCNSSISSLYIWSDYGKGSLLPVRIIVVRTVDTARASAALCMVMKTLVILRTLCDGTTLSHSMMEQELPDISGWDTDSMRTFIMEYGIH